MVEAIKAALAMLPQQSVVLRFLLSGAGDLNVSDVDLAAASGGMVLAFNLEVRGRGRGRGRERGRGRGRGIICMIKVLCNLAVNAICAITR